MLGEAITRRLTRRSFLAGLGATTALPILAACQPQVVERIVEKPVIQKETVVVERVVEKEKLVEKPIEVEKEVTRVVEKVVEVETEKIVEKVVEKPVQVVEERVVVATPLPPEPVTLVVLYPGNLEAPENAPIKQVYDDFAATNSYISWDVRSLPGGSDWDRLARTSIAAGEPVDMVSINGQFLRAWVRDNLVLELSTFADLRDVLNRAGHIAFRNLLMPEPGREYMVTGAVTGGTAVCVWYYNSLLYDKAGVAIPETTGDLIESVPAFKDLGAAPWVHPAGDPWWNPLLVMWIQPMVVDNKPIVFTEDTQRGKVPYDSPEWIETFRILQELHTTEVLLKGSSALHYNDSNNLFMTGKSATSYNGSWSLGAYADPPADAEFELHITGLPLAAGAPFAQPLIVCGSYAVPAFSKHTDEVFKFFHYITDPEIDERVTQAMQRPSPRLESNTVITNPLQPEIQPWYKNGIVPLDWLWEPEITTEVQNNVQTLLKGEISPEDVSRALRAKHEQLVRENRSYFEQT